VDRENVIGWGVATPSSVEIASGLRRRVVRGVSRCRAEAIFRGSSVSHLQWCREREPEARGEGYTENRPNERCDRRVCLVLSGVGFVCRVVSCGGAGRIAARPPHRYPPSLIGGWKVVTQVRMVPLLCFVGVFEMCVDCMSVVDIVGQSWYCSASEVIYGESSGGVSD
jgi:hypothetical protein